MAVNGYCCEHQSRIPETIPRQWERDQTADGEREGWSEGGRPGRPPPEGGWVFGVPAVRRSGCVRSGFQVSVSGSGPGHPGHDPDDQTIPIQPSGPNLNFKHRILGCATWLRAIHHWCHRRGLPPRALTNRWESKSNVERFLIHCGYKDCPEIFEKCVRDGQRKL